MVTEFAIGTNINREPSGDGTSGGANDKFALGFSTNLDVFRFLSNIVGGNREVSLLGYQVSIEYADGQFLAEDDEFHSYGIGETREEALKDWQQALFEHYEVLLDNEDDLSSLLIDQLSIMKSRLQEYYIATNTA